MPDFSTFSNVISQWGLFYTTAAGVSATLLGLLFVGIRLRIDVIGGSPVVDIYAQAVQTYVSFSYPLIASFVFLIPNQTPISVGVPLLFIGAFGFLTTLRILWARIRVAKNAQTPYSRMSRLHSTARLVGFAVLIFLAFEVYQGQIGWLPFIGAAVLWLLGVATRSAFSLVMDARFEGQSDTANT